MHPDYTQRFAIVGSRTAITRRGVLGMTFAAGSAVGLAACGRAERPEGARGDTGATPYTLTWGIRTSAPPEAVDALTNDYRRTRPHVTIEQFNAPGGIVPSLEKLAAGLAAGLRIDVLTGQSVALQLVETYDLVQPIDDLMRRDKFDLGKYNKDFVDSHGRYDGKLHALPYGYAGNVAAVVYNRALFASAGAKAPSHEWSTPWTWDEFRDAMRRLTKSEGGRQVQVGAAGFGYYVTTPVRPWDARWLTLDFKTITCDSPETIDAYTRYADLLFRDRVFAQSPGADLGSGDAFLNGKAGIALPCCSALDYAKKIPPGIDWGFVTMPKGKSSTLELSVVVMALGKSARDRTEAWEFLKFLDDKSRLATMENRTPTLLPDMPGWIREKFALWPTSNAAMLAEGYRNARRSDAFGFHPERPKMVQQVLDPGWKEVMAQNISVVEFLRQAKPRLQLIVDEYARRRPKR